MNRTHILCVPMLAVAVLAATTLGPGAAYASGSDLPRIALRATVYDRLTGEAVNLAGHLLAKVDTTGSASRGWRVKLKVSLVNVSGAGLDTSARYRATGADFSTVRSPAGPAPRAVSFTPVFTLHPPSPAKAQSFTLMVIASFSNGGKLIGLEVRSPAPPVTFGIDATVQPDRSSIPGAPGQPARPLARLADSLGNSTDFVANELTIATDDPTVLLDFTDRWEGQVLSTIQQPPGSSTAAVYVVRVDPSTADIGALPTDVAALDATAHGSHRASSEAALRLFAAAVSENAAGLRVGLNTLSTPLDYMSGVTSEAPAGDNDPATGGAYSSNSAGWSYMRAGGIENFGVAEAWRMLAIGGRLSNRVKVGIIDTGCALTNPDYPAGTTGGNDLAAVPGDPWHCTNVAVTAGGQPDNGFGSAGTGGPVVDLRLYPTDMTDANSAARVYDALGDGMKIINMSFGASNPAITDLLSNALEDAVEVAHNTNVLVFAAAGNAKPGQASQDVDHETCYFVCVEEAVHKPCEFDGVICVGGLRSGSHDRDINSYYCLDQRDEGICDVDLYAPFTVYRGVQPSTPGDNSARLTQGTSFSSPYAAGVAALIWAANPSLNNVQIEGILSNGLPTTDRTVTAPIDARGGVLRAFGGNVPPSVRVTAPADGSTVDYGGVNAVRFSAESLDVEEGANVVDLTWASDVDGPLGQGQSIDFVFPTTGNRRITVTAKDRSGATGTASISVIAVNRPPQVSIVSPWHGQELYVGVEYHFIGEVADQINAPQPELCGGLTWTSDVFLDDPFPVTGCRPSIRFSTPGSRTITASYTDAEGATGTATADVYIVDQPANSPPVVVIDSPADGQSFQYGAIIPLRGSVFLEPGESSPVEYAWYLNGVLIDEAENIDFKPGDLGYVAGDSVLTFGARDDDGYAQTSIAIRIAAIPK